MNKVSLCPLINKVLVYEETDTISQSIFNSKKRLFDSSKNTGIQKRPKHIQNVSNKIMPIHNINNNKILAIHNINNNINNINNNKNNIKKINVNNNDKFDKLLYIKNILKYSRLKFNKIFERNYNIFIINCIINKVITICNINDDKYIKQYYCYDDSIKIIPKKEVYYKHHMLYLEAPNFKNGYFNRMKKNYCLEKLNIYLNKRKKEKTPEQLNNSKNNLKEQDNNKIFNTSILETIENYSTTITQGSNNEKYPPLTPFEIFKRCEDTNKKKKDTQIKEQKSIITFSESEISYKSKTIIDKSLIGVVQDLSQNPNKFRQYKEKNINIIHNSNNSKSLTNKKQISNIKDIKDIKDIKRGINTIYSLKQNFYEINIQEKKYTNFFLKKKDIEKFTKVNKNINNNINIKNNRNNYDDKEVINKKRESTSTNRKNKKILFDKIYQNTISKCNSKEENFINNITSNKNEENKTSNYPSFGLRRKNKGVLNLKKESYKIRRHVTKLSDNYIISDNSHSNSNNNTNSNLVSTSYNGNIDNFKIFFNPKDKNQYEITTKSKYAEFSYNNAKRRQIKKNTTFTMVNNINNLTENSQEKYKNKKDTNFKSKSPLSLIVTKKNVNESNNKRKRTYKKKKTVLIPTSFQYMKLNKRSNKINLLK